MNEIPGLNEWIAFGGVVSLQATILLGGAWLAANVLRRRPAAERHVVWTVAVVGVIALPFLGPLIPSLQVSSPVWSGSVAESVPAAVHEAISAEWSTDGAREPVAPPARLEEYVAARPASRAVLPLTLVLSIWLAGMLAVSAVTLLAVIQVRKLARRGREVRDPVLLDAVQRVAADMGVMRPVRVLEGDADTMPMTFGVSRATLLLPSNARTWSSARLQLVLRHELAHIRRRDTLTQFVADIGCAIYWFHPLMWLAARQLRVEREHACDDVVLISGARATDYAAELVAIARTMRIRPVSSPAAIAMARPTGLRTRITAVLEDRTRTDRVSRRLLVPFWAGALVIVTTIAALAPAPAETVTAVPAVSLSESVDAVSPSETATAVSPSEAVGAVSPSETAGGVAADSPFENAATVSARARVENGSLAAGANLPASPTKPQSQCWEGTGNTFTRTVNRSGDGSHRDSYTLIQQRHGDMEVCMKADGPIPFDERGLQLSSMRAGDRLVLAARTPGGDHRIEILATTAGHEQTWFVNGTERAFDQTAAEWRDAMLAVLSGYAEAGRIRGEASTLRGKIATMRGRESTLKGEIATIRGQVSTMRGQISTVRGHEASMRGQVAAIRGQEAGMRGQIATIRGHEATMRGEIASLLGRIASLESARRTTGDAQTRARLEAEVQEVKRAIEEVERRIAEFDADSRIAEVERGIAEFDSDSKIREVENHIRAGEVADRVREIEGRIEAFDADARIREVESRMAGLKTEESILQIERKLEALDADRRVRQIEERMEPQVRRLREIQGRIQ